METKRLIAAMLLALMVVFGYNAFINWLWQKNGWERPGSTPTTQVSSTAPATTTESSITTAPSMATTNPTAEVSTGGLRAIGAASPSTQPVTLGSAKPKDPTYAMELQILPRGSALKGVALNQFKWRQNSPLPYSFEEQSELEDRERALATRSVTINGTTVDLSTVVWSLDSSDSAIAKWFVDIESDGKPFARVWKTYRLDSRTESKGKSEGYELTVTLSVENRSGSAMTFNTTLNGPLSPTPEAARMDRTVLAAYDVGGSVELSHHAIEELTASNPSRELTRDDKSHPAVWFGIGGTYFNAIMRPQPVEQTNVTPAESVQYVQKIESHAVHPEIQREHPIVCETLATTDLKVDPGATLSIPIRVFFGPKLRSLLNSKYYSAPLMAYDKTLIMTSGPCSACTFPWLIDVLVKLLGMFWYVTRDWGIAIICLVCLVRLILHPITKKSQVNMMKMGKMGPAIEQLKKKYGDDKEAMTKAQMELYKEMGFTPVLGCLPMFLQMPIFIALWQALQSTFELRHAPFLWFGNLHLTWISDLSQPDRLISFGRQIPLVFGWHIDAINLLPILVAVVSFLNMKYTPRPPAATPEAEQQQKMMQWMTLIFPLMFYTFPSGLNIYYLTSTSLGIVEGKRIRAHIKEREEAEKAGKVIVDASPGRRRPPTSGIGSSKGPEEPKGGLGGLLARLQAKADEIAQGNKSNPKK